MDEAEKIRNFYNMLNRSYALNKYIPPVIFPQNKKSWIILGQYIDTYGKTRQLNISLQVDQIRITIMTSPIPPFKAPLAH